jgi:uncharacterized SAM-dependent methyltransferase
MHLCSRWAQHVTIAKTAQTIAFAAGETIHTENSYKYSIEDIRTLGQQASLTLSRTWSRPPALLCPGPVPQGKLRQ